MPQNLLEQLRQYTVVVADTGDIEAMEKFHPQDATTNPSLITAAAQMPQYQPIVDGVLMDARNELGEGATDQAVANLAFQRLAIAFGKKILAIVPGRVSTEVDARLSYDTEATIAQARSIIAQYDAAGIGRERVLIKIASTWEGIRAAEVLEKEGIHCNLTLLFGLHQAIAAAEAGVTLDLALRGPHSRLVQEGHRQGLPRRRRSRRAVGDAHLQLLQEIRLQDRGDGRELPQHRRDHRAGRLRPAHHFAATAGRAGSAPKATCRASSIPRRPQSMQHRKDRRWTRPPSTRMHAADRMATDKLKEGIEGFSAALVKLETLLAKRLAELESRTPAAV